MVLIVFQLKKFHKVTYVINYELNVNFSIKVKLLQATQYGINLIIIKIRK